MTYARDDFELVRCGSTAYPWGARHIATGAVVATPYEFEHPNLGPVATSALYHRRKRDAAAALDAFLARQGGDTPTN